MNVRTIISAVVALLLCPGCSSLFEREPEVLEVSGDATCGAMTKNLTLSVDCDVKWTVALEHMDWARIEAPEKNASKGGGTIKLAFDYNTAKEDRSGEVVVRSGSRELRTTVTQGGMDSFFQPSEIRLYGTASSVLKFNTPLEWSIEISEGAKWMTLDVTSGPAGPVAVYIRALDPNEDIGSRTGSLRVKLGKYEYSLPVVQDQKDVILSDDADIRLDHHACEFAVRTNSNVGYEVQIPVPWIHHIPGTKALIEATERFSVDENTGAEGRSATVDFISPSGASLRVLVFQASVDKMLSVSTPGIYGMDGMDYILGRDGWRMSSRVVDADGCFEYRLANPAALSVYKMAGFDENAVEGDTFEVHVVRQEKDAVTVVRDYQSTVIGTSDKLLWLKTSDGVYFIIQR
ncbi:MAG: BACON domain-containing protein [Bacteroidales bacterium]|nr:BACON domain-containing protein [Bacteroidales bacterium]